MWGCRLLRTHPGIENLPLLFSTRGLDTNRLFPPTILQNFSWRAVWILDSIRLKDRTLIVIGEPCCGFSGITYRHTIYVWSTDAEWIQRLSRNHRAVSPAFGWVFAFLPFNTKPAPYIPFPICILSHPIHLLYFIFNSFHHDRNRNTHKRPRT